MDYFNSASQEKIIRHYLPEKLIHPDWTCDHKYLNCNLRNLISKGDNALRLFSNEEDLAAELQNYSHFPGNFKLFGIDHAEDIFKNEGPTFTSLKNKKYAYIHFYFYNFYQLASGFSKKFDRLVFEAIGLYLKCLYSRVKNYSELVPYDDSPFSGLIAVLHSFTQKLEDENQKSIDDLKNFTRKCFKTFRDTGSEGFEVEFQEILNRSLEILPIKTNGKAYYKMYATIDYVIRKFDEMFEYLNFRSQTTDPAVRLFNINGEHVVMAHELFHILKGKSYNTSSLEKAVKRLPKTEVYELKELAESMHKDLMENLEFVKVPLPTPKLSLAIIPTFDGGYVVQADRALAKIGAHMILVDKVFQMMTPDRFRLIDQFFSSILKEFRKRFMDYDTFKSIKDKWSRYFETHFKNTAVDRREVRNVDETRGFTLEDLKEELVYLGVTEVFPGAFEVAEKFYTDMVKQEWHKLNTSMLIHATWVSQNECLTNLLRQISTISGKSDSKPTRTHERRDPFATAKPKKIELTSRRLAHSDAQNTGPKNQILNSSVSEKSQNPGCSDVNTSSSSPASSKIEEPTSADASDSELAQKPTPSKLAFVETPQKKKPAKQPKVASQKPEDAKEAVPESKACNKCFKSSESYRDANAKLKQSKEDNKQLRRDMANSELEAEQLKEVVRMLREKLHQKNVQIYDMAQEKEKLVHELSEKNVIIEVMQAEAAVPKNPHSVQLVQTVPASEESKDALLKLLSIRNTLQVENPIEQSTKILNDVIGKTKNEEIREMAKSEMEAYHKTCKAYENAVDTQINQILGLPTYTDDPSLPEFPVLSQQFQVVYKKVMRSEVPKICESLREDPDCTICLSFLNYPLKTTKCGKCKKSCHLKCVTGWFKENRSCPSCRTPMYDDKEFPSLSK